MPVMTKSKQTPLSIGLPEPLREHWEAHFQGTGGSTAELAFDAVAELSFFGGALEGDGFAAAFPTNQEKLTFTGANYDRYVDFETWLHVVDLGRKPFVCIGTVDLGAGTMAGSFTVDCIEPETCGCGGGSGQFSMCRATELE